MEIIVIIVSCKFSKRCNIARVIPKKYEKCFKKMFWDIFVQLEDSSDCIYCSWLYELANVKRINLFITETLFHGKLICTAIYVTVKHKRTS